MFSLGLLINLRVLILKMVKLLFVVDNIID